VHSIYNQVLVHFVRQPKNVIYFPIIYFILIKYAVLTYTFKSYTLAYLYLHISFGQGAGEKSVFKLERKHWGISPVVSVCFFIRRPQWKQKIQWNVTKRPEMERNALTSICFGRLCWLGAWHVFDKLTLAAIIITIITATATRADFQVLYSYWFQTELEMQMTDLFFMLSLCSCQSNCRRCWLMSSRWKGRWDFEWAGVMH